MKEQLKNHPDESAHDEHMLTRQRLLEAAGEVFAEVGFKGATVRDICGRAGANVAAVNYHFGDKERLYSAVLRYAHSVAAAKLSPLSIDPATPAAEKLGGFIWHMLHKILGEGRPAWHGKLMSREMVDPTPALDELVASEIRPMHDLLKTIVIDLLGPQASGDRILVARCMASVIGQCLFYHNCRPVIDRLGLITHYDPAELAPHVTAFSLAGIAAMAASAKAASAPSSTDRAGAKESQE